MQRFYLEYIPRHEREIYIYLYIYVLTAEQYVKSTGVYIETHDVYTRISNASYAGLLLCNDLSLVIR